MKAVSYSCYEAEEYKKKLRDQIAMAALTGFLSYGNDIEAAKLARMAYFMADVMMNERIKK